ncbi:MAG: GNAT family N-acetyltransferase [Actinomycetota bacterium]|nr:GNAT family N-acetyltransferase [Actinomycetota bacterium]
MKIDRALVCRVEHSGAAIAVLQARAIAALAPDSGATATPFDGGALVAFGPGRYVNRAMGVGLGGTAAGEVVDAIDAFYAEHHMAPSLELSPWTDEAIIRLLGARGYRTERFRNVYVAALPVAARPITHHPIERLTVATAAARTAMLAGDAPVGSDARRISDEMCATAAMLPDPHDFVAVVDGEPVACGSLNVADGVGWVGGAATFPAYRGRGLQTALLDHRLRLAHQLGCELAAATALPDGQSASNLVACGFRLLYTQAVLTRPAR